MFGIELTTLVLSMVLLGGRATIYGALLASLFLTFFAEAIADLGPWRPIVIGVLIILVMLICPDGLIGLAKAGFQRLTRRLSRSSTIAAQSAAIERDEGAGGPAALPAAKVGWTERQ